ADNCEHLVEAAAKLVDHLLARCSGLSVLATSREPLGIAGEVLHPVGPLAVPEGEVPPTEAQDWPAGGPRGRPLPPPGRRPPPRRRPAPDAAGGDRLELGAAGPRRAGAAAAAVGVRRRGHPGGGRAGLRRPRPRRPGRRRG